MCKYSLYFYVHEISKLRIRILCAKSWGSQRKGCAYILDIRAIWHSLDHQGGLDDLEEWVGSLFHVRLSISSMLVTGRGLLPSAHVTFHAVSPCP